MLLKEHIYISPYVHQSAYPQLSSLAAPSCRSAHVPNEEGYRSMAFPPNLFVGNVVGRELLSYMRGFSPDCIVKASITRHVNFLIPSLPDLQAQLEEPFMRACRFIISAPAHETQLCPPVFIYCLHL